MKNDLLASLSDLYLISCVDLTYQGHNAGFEALLREEHDDVRIMSLTFLVQEVLAKNHSAKKGYYTLS